MRVKTIKRHKMDRRGLLMAALLGGIIAIMIAFAVAFVDIKHEKVQSFKLFAEVIVAALGVIAEVAVAWFIYLELKHSQREELITSTKAIYEAWWSGDMRDHRKALKRFMDNDRAALMLKPGSMKDVDHVSETQAALPGAMPGSVVNLVHFFDRVGWLGASGMIDVDYVLGPMEHIVRRTWMTMSDLIVNERKRRLMAGERLDPVYNFGFEWLYRYTSKPGNDQASLMATLYDPEGTVPSMNPEMMREQIHAEEDDFQKYLESRGSSKIGYGVNPTL